ncbi:glycosyltransferase family 2 protein [Streptosporangium sp. NPDC020072]|uniref:Glycosyltransferase family 2 protein n=1 Tax=Streptosporangium jomthongense TaxID=1193683 RepID=A0ABV8F3B8_9ACTN
MTPGPPRIAIVIVTYNSAQVIEGCLRSLGEGARGVNLVHVIVADNNSKDDCLKVVGEVTDLPVQVVQVGRNAGYAAAINAGVEVLDVATLDAVLVLNPDCRLRPGSLLPLAESLRRPGRGIAAPLLVNPDGSLQPSLRRMPAVGRAVVEAVIGGNLAGRIGTLGEMVTHPREYAKAGEVAWATGAAMLISTDVIKEIGAWDESFLLYSEETEFSLRARDHGWITWYEPASVVEHIGGDSAINPMLASLLIVNKVKLFRRRRSTPAFLAYYLAVVLGEALRALMGRRISKASVVALLRPSRRVHKLAD